MKASLGIFFAVLAALTGAQQIYSTPRGAQVRLTHSGMNYALDFGVKKLQEELTNKRIDSQSGRTGDIHYTASNIFIKYLRVGRESVQPRSGNGILVSMQGISVEASAKIDAQFRKGWVKVGDSTKVQIKGRNIGYTLNVQIGANNGKPNLRATSCSASIGDIDLNFNGGLAWLYNIFATLFKSQLKDVLKKVICEEGVKIINTEANNFLKGFPVQQNIENVAIINYAFQTPVVTSNYIDFLLRGEFLDPNHPVHSGKTPPSFNTVTSSNKMAYVWITDFTLDSAGDVFHKTGLLKKLVGPLSKEIPAEVQPFLNTASFKDIIPELYNRFPNRPIEFQLSTNKAPTFKTTTGKISVMLHVRAGVVVAMVNGTKLPVFYLDLDVDASGSVFVKSVNNQLQVGGNVAGFTFGAKIGGSVLGDINIPLDDPSIRSLVQGLVIENANPVLEKGFPIPRIDDLDFINPQVSFVQGAIRVDTDIRYRG